MKGKVITVTGAASGIGLATAKLLASLGAKVSLSDVQQGPLQKVVREIETNSGTAFGTVVDVSNRKQVEDWVGATVEKYGKLDGVANVAGVTGGKIGGQTIDELDDAEWDFVIGVNQKGVLNCMRAAIPHIKEGGSIVNVASVAGLIAFPNSAPYVASKHAVIGLTKVAAKELGVRNIRCNSVCPGPIETAMYTESAEVDGKPKLNLGEIVALKRSGQAVEVANLIEFLLSDKATYITGSSQMVDGGWVC